ncbi:hypothetical protein JTE90_004836 [Oedothorax gibbosus]|uniref:Uncharacterized protein n=1 Tax=Oedothorax gibbosus TaxID=931172 RepID=A0AAV6UQD5_9ARAC|nr:hypothetical protein JTE90_004836 [Oedothorax gibbosus]
MIPRDSVRGFSNSTRQISMVLPTGARRTRCEPRQWGTPRTVGTQMKRRNEGEATNFHTDECRIWNPGLSGEESVALKELRGPHSCEDQTPHRWE